MKFSTAIGTLALSTFLAAHSALAQFNPGPNPIPSGTTTGAQTLSSGTGTINSGGAISTSGSTVALSMTETSTLINNGTIQQTGTGRAIDSNSGIANLTVMNSGLISAVSTDAFRVNTNSAVSLTNSGTIRVTAGGQAIDWAAITSASSSLTNQSAGVITAVGEDAVRPGTNGLINNAGMIMATPTGTTNPSGSDGIQANGSGVVVTNTGTISGRHGITGGAPGFSITVHNDAGTIAAVNGSGINIDDLGSSATVTNAAGATIKGGVTSASTDGDGDGVDVDGVLSLTNSGDILGLGAKGVGSDGLPNNAEGVAMGGGSITNNATGRIIGSTSASDAPNGDPTRAGNGILVDDSSGGNAIAATTITNSGLIQGQSGGGIKVIGTFANTITNNAGGTIRGAGGVSLGAAIQTGNGNDTVNNSGAIIGGNGLAIDLQGGNNTLNIMGGSASVSGDISGGLGGTNAITIDPGSGNSFSYAGVISNFSSAEIKSGTVTLSGASTYTGNTTISGGKLLAQNGSGSATGSGSVAVNSGATLGGNGTIGGNVSVLNGGIISPGTSAGQLNISGNLTVMNGSRFVFELGPTSDRVTVAGSFVFTGSGQTFFDIVDLGIAAGGDYTLISFSSSSGVTSSNLSLGSTPAGFSGTLNLNSNSVTLHVDAVPEPSTVVLGVVGLAALSLFSRRKLSELLIRPTASE